MRQGQEQAERVLFPAGEFAQEFLGRFRPSGFRFPLKSGEVDTAPFVDANPFMFEEAPLLLKAPPPFERDPTAAVDDPMPGELVLDGG